MPFIQTTALKKILGLKKRLKILQGGSSAGKTIGVLLDFIDDAQSRKGVLASVVSETMPHLRRGAIRDFLNIMEQHGYYKDDNWNKSEFTYTFETGSKIEFFSADQPAKVRGPRRNRLFINEANNISFETYTQLVIRTDEDIFIDYNPVSEFWVHTDVIPKQDHDFLVLTYRDNEGLSPTIVQEIESRRGRKDWWSVFGLGQLGEIQGKIYANWEVIDEVPKEARLERRWLDFGYTNDPSAIGDLYYGNGSYYLDEQLYQKGMSNKNLADFLMNLEQPKVLVIADSAEPKSIDEIKAFGVNIVPSIKGKDSVNQGIQLVKDQKIFVTKRSVNIIKENRNYLWMVDKDDRIINVEDPNCANHHMSGIRYAFNSLIPVIRRKEYIATLPRYQEKSKPNPAR